MKTCIYCKKEKPLSEYYPQKNTLDGVMSQCMKCLVPDLKVCKKCGIEKPNTTEHFYRHTKNRPGLRTICKLCMNGVNWLEKDFTLEVVNFLIEHNWYVVHFTIPRILGQTGYPDITAVREDRMVFIELKTDNGYVAPHQKKWHAQLEKPLSNEVYVIAPKQWNKYKKMLT